MERLKVSVTARLLIFAFFDDFMLIYPLYAVMFAHAGLTPLQITSLLVVWSLTAFLLNVPAGVIADRYPRRVVLIAGLLLRAVGYGAWLAVPHYSGFLIGFVLWGLKSALTSGTTEALVYDELNRARDLPAYARVTGRMTSFSFTAVVLASLVASLVASWGYGPLLLCSMAAIVVSAIAVGSLPSAPRTEPVDTVSYLQTLRDGTRMLWDHSSVLFLVGLASLVGGLGSVDEYFGLFLHQRAFTDSGIAAWTAVIFLLSAVGAALAHRWEHRSMPVVALLMVWALMLYAAAVAPGVLAPLLLAGFYLFFGAGRVLTNARLQRLLTDSVRATVTSAGSVGAEFLALVSYGLMGLGADVSHGYAGGYEWIAIALGAVGIGLIPLQKRVGHAPK